MPKRVLVLGSQGMLGSQVLRHLQEEGHDVVGSSRRDGIQFDAKVDSVDELLDASRITRGDFVVNCIGLTKTHMRNESPENVKNAATLNVVFPASLAIGVEKLGARVIQVATDCVFSGSQGRYHENSAHDASDLYGKTKSLGEIDSPSVMHLRCSLIGPERASRNTLFFEWVRNLPIGSSVLGFTNHWWNGLTTDTFSRVVSGVIRDDMFSSGMQHLVPSDSLSKYELVKMVLSFLSRTDVHLEAHETDVKVDRTLTTNNPDSNCDLFLRAGFGQVPSIREMMEILPWKRIRERKE